MEPRQLLFEIFLKSKEVCTDTRQIVPGAMYFALKGVRFDGNQFTAQALDTGACISVTDDPTKKDLPGHIYVNNVLQSLQYLASDYRDTFTAPVIGITGSNGKTTTKELVLAVLQTKYTVCATKGNLNNHIGVPLTLLSVKGDEDYIVVEMGANYPDEIAALCTMSKPDIGLITSIGKAHLEGFGSVDVIARTKAGLFNSVMNNNGSLFFHEKDSRYLKPYIGEYSQQICIPEGEFFLNDSKCNFHLLEDLPKISYELLINNEVFKGNSQLPGAYNFYNIKLATSLGVFLHIDPKQIVRGINEYHAENNRSQWVHIGIHRILLDAYNANPTSMEAAIYAFGKMPGSKKVLVLGGMKELGSESVKEHQVLLDSLCSYGFERIFLIGEEFKPCEIPDSLSAIVADKIQVKKWLETAQESYMVFIKGSRAYALETIVEP